MQYNGSYVELTGRDKAAIAIMARRGINVCESRIAMNERKVALFEDSGITVRELITYMMGFYDGLGFIPMEVLDYIMRQYNKGRLEYDY